MYMCLDWAWRHWRCCGSSVAVLVILCFGLRLGYVPISFRQVCYMPSVVQHMAATLLLVACSPLRGVDHYRFDILCGSLNPACETLEAHVQLFLGIYPLVTRQVVGSLRSKIPRSVTLHLFLPFPHTFSLILFPHFLNLDTKPGFHIPLPSSNPIPHSSLLRLPPPQVGFKHSCFR